MYVFLNSNLYFASIKFKLKPKLLGICCVLIYNNNILSHAPLPKSTIKLVYIIY